MTAERPDDEWRVEFDAEVVTGLLGLDAIAPVGPCLHAVPFPGVAAAIRVYGVVG